MSSKEVDDSVLEEGCYYLTELGVAAEQIAKNFGVTKRKVESLANSYAEKLRSRRVVPDTFDRTFWEDVKKEAEGDVKVTFVSERGIHHGWKSELRKLDGPSLMSIFEASKDFLNADPNQRFLDFEPPPGFDPLALEREVKKTVAIISDLMGEKAAQG